MNEHFEFEQQLRNRDLPATDHLTSDTFYQAGWEACASQKLALKNSVPENPATRVSWASARQFVMGLVCGVLAVAGMRVSDVGDAVPQRTEVTDSSIGAVGVTRVEEADDTDLQPEPIDGAHGNWESFMAGLSPWGTRESRSSVLAATDVKPSTVTSALSPVARRTWSQVVLASPLDASSVATSGSSTTADSGDAGSTDSNREFRPLRSFPATRDIYDGLL